MQQPFLAFPKKKSGQKLFISYQEVKRQVEFTGFVCWGNYGRMTSGTDDLQ